MEPPVRVTQQTRALLEQMLRDPGADYYGFEISKATGLRPSTLYPTFARLERAGWLESRWERIDPDCTRRPPRRYYRLTKNGVSEAQNALSGGAEGEQRPGILGT
ncbi:MAG: helix-turn-helix transcriptional regulator [Acidimicrobiales bacterium]